jgi:hypothetical protein
VRDHKAAGYDLLKVHEGLTREAYAAIASTAREVGLTWGGHVASDVAVSGALAEHQISIDHIDDYIDALQKDGSPALSLDGFARADAMPMNVDESKYAVLARQTRDAGVTIVPTSALWETILGVHPTADLMKRPELKYMPRAMVEGWATTIDRRRMDRDRMSASMEVRVRNRMLKALDDGGAMILMGTDAPQLFSVPGFSVHREMQILTRPPRRSVRRARLQRSAFYNKVSPCRIPPNRCAVLRPGGPPTFGQFRSTVRFNERIEQIPGWRLRVGALE